jgi:ABC-type transport system involved in cytochrome bd biosynthesis fused ATPase/permease subunit
MRMSLKKVILWWFSTDLIFPNGFWGVMGCIVVISFLGAFSIPFAAYIIPVIYVLMIFLTVVGGMYIKEIRKEIGKG